MAARSQADVDPDLTPFQMLLRARRRVVVGKAVLEEQDAPDGRRGRRILAG
jgi:hypothetical protein